MAENAGRSQVESRPLAAASSQVGWFRDGGVMFLGSSYFHWKSNCCRSLTFPFDGILHLFVMDIWRNLLGRGKGHDMFVYLFFLL